MKNIINYYYNLNIVDCYINNDRYYFYIDNTEYIFMNYDKSIEELSDKYNLYSNLKNKNILVNDIITNINNQIITIVNGKAYILLRNNCKSRNFNLNDILYLQNNTDTIFSKKKGLDNNWIKLWKIKIDYYENQFINLSKINSLIYNTLDYYIGLGENAISYLSFNNCNNNRYCVSHSRISINEPAFDFYNPINFIIDNRVRDFAELIKNMFFLDKIDFDTFILYLNTMNFNKSEYLLLVSRLLFPTFYFDFIDDILNKKIDETYIKRIINKTDSYILFLKSIMMHIIYNKRINIPIIDWIIKKTD